jgi:1-deoxy-D-xylulose-5-phosphate synthase
MSILEHINEPNDIKKIEENDIDSLCEEIREFLLEHVSQTGGHLASNLGCVELTVALHRCLDLPKDKIIWDVGHQAYVHKLLTGRKEEFDHLRQLGGISGFPKSSESPCDAFNTGHSSTSMSAALGMACARSIRGTDEKIVAVIGDGSFTGGMVYEALNNMSNKKTGCLIILNDNEMSIDPNVGGMSKYLNRIRIGQPYNEFKGSLEKALHHIPVAGDKIVKKLKKSKDSIKQMFVPGMFFEELGITYVGPVDGHDVTAMEEIFTRALMLDRPVLVHVKTVKGKGYKYAEKHPSYFHGIEPFDQATGKILNQKTHAGYTTVFSRKLLELGKQNPDIVAITAAMGKGTGVDRFAAEFPDRAFDVGIAEEHAVTFAAGLAAAGMIPVVAIYSSFLQRAYDQIIHDVCLQKLHVIFAIDRSGIVGADGDTHQGIFDTAFLSHIPGMTILAPKNRYELEQAMDWAAAFDGPVAIKYARGTAYRGLKEFNQAIEYGKSELLYKGSDIAVLAVGDMMEEAVKLREMLLAEGKEITLVNPRFIKPVDYAMIHELAENHRYMVIMEDGIHHGGYASMIEEYIAENKLDINIINADIRDSFVPHGTVKELKASMNMDAEAVYKLLLKLTDEE